MLQDLYANDLGISRTQKIQIQSSQYLLDAHNLARCFSVMAAESSERAFSRIYYFS